MKLDAVITVLTVIAATAVCILVAAGFPMPEWDNAIFAGAAGCWALFAFGANLSAARWRAAAERWEATARVAAEYAVNLKAASSSATRLHSPGPSTLQGEGGEPGS